MLYVAGFNEKNPPQLYVYAENFSEAFKKVEDWCYSHPKYTLVCINEFVTDVPVEIDPICYEVNTKKIQLTLKNELSLYGVRYVEKDESDEIEKVFISNNMGSIVLGISGEIKGLWRIIGKDDILLI